MLIRLKRYWEETDGYQKILYTTGFLLLASAIFHSVVLIISGGSLEGDVSFRKAITFGEAFGLTVCSLAWFLTFLPKKRALWWMLCGIYAIATFLEVLMVTMQVWRGVPSHFNFTSRFDAAVFGIMGLSISLHLPLILVVLVLSFSSLKAPDSLKWAIRAGMVLLMASQVFGTLMIFRGNNTFGLAGQMKIPHALGLHAVQVLPVIAWLLMFRNWHEHQRTRLVIFASASYAALVAVTASQALNGLPVFELSLPAAFILIAAAAVLGTAMLLALNGLRQKIKP